MQLLSDFGSYLKAVFLDGIQRIFLLFDLLGVFLFFLPELAPTLAEESVARTVGGGLFLVSFLLANFSVYRKMAGQLSYRADIHFETEQHDFSPSHGSVDSPFREVQRNPHGFNKQGLPDWASLWARIIIRNTGHEKGGWEAELDETKIKLPLLFDRQNIQTVPGRPINDVPPREARIMDFYTYVLFTERDPEAFAQAIKALVQSRTHYKFVFRYWTVNVDGKSKPRQISIKGDFQGFYDEVVKYWRDYGFPELAELARLPDP